VYLDAGAERLLRETALAGRRAATETAIVLVICVKGITRIRRDYGRHSIATSFYSAQELNDIIEAFRSIGYYVQHFADEVDFISWVNAGGLRALSHPNKLVYVGAVNGTGPGRRCLLPSFCALEGIHTLNSDAYSSAINRHKFHWTKLLGSFGIRVPQSWLFEVGRGWLMDEAPVTGQRVIAKALHEGSSIGVSEAGVGEWSPAIAEHIETMASDFKQPIMVQEFVTGSEVEVPVLELGASRIAAPVMMLKNDGTDLANDFLSYDLVWDDNYSFAAPSGLDADVRARLEIAATRVCELLNFRLLSRVDFRIDSAGKEYVIDISTTPHLTRHSSYDHLFAGLGLGYADVMATLVGAGLATAPPQSSAQY
jgi:D-alanine-D-alanine ligase